MNATIVWEEDEGTQIATYNLNNEWLAGCGDTRGEALEDLQEQVQNITGTRLDVLVDTKTEVAPVPTSVPRVTKKDNGWITPSSDLEAWKVICLEAIKEAQRLSEGERENGIIDIRSGLVKDVASGRMSMMVNNIMRSKRAVGAYEILKNDRTYISFTDIPNALTYEAKAGSGAYREATTKTISGNSPVPGQISYSSPCVSLITGEVQELEGPNDDDVYARMHLKEVGFSSDEIKAIEGKKPGVTREEAIEGIADEYMDTLQRSHTVEYTRWTKPGQDSRVVRFASALRNEAKEKGLSKRVQGVWYAVGYCRGIRELGLPAHSELEAHLREQGIAL